MCEANAASLYLLVEEDSNFEMPSVYSTILDQSLGSNSSMVLFLFNNDSNFPFDKVKTLFVPLVYSDNEMVSILEIDFSDKIDFVLQLDIVNRNIIAVMIKFFIMICFSIFDKFKCVLVR